MREFKICTTPTADVSADYIYGNDCIVVANPIIHGEDVYMDDFKNFDAMNIYNWIEEGTYPTTASNNTNQYLEAWKPYLDQGYDIINIDISSGLSQTQTSVQRAADILNEEYGETRVYPVDGTSISGGQTLLVMKAVELKNQGWSAEEVYNYLNENALKVNHLFTSGDLTSYYRGGRITKAQMVLGSSLNIYPFMDVSDQGKLVPRKKVMGRKKALKTLVNVMEERADKGLDYDDAVVIAHSNCPEDAEFVKKMIEEKFSKIKSLDIYMIRYIGVHTGPGTTALFFWGKERDPE